MSQDSVYFNRRFEPEAGRILHGAGQSPEAFVEYVEALGAEYTPLLYMLYTGLRGDPSRLEAKLREMDALLPVRLVPQIGLSMTVDGTPEKHYEHRVAEGLHDTELRALCLILRDFKRPVFVRLGYEFNGRWNGYEPESYIRAWRHVVTTLQEQGADNVATVWCFAPGGDPDYVKWYPGDEYIDWWAIDLFSPEHFELPETRRFMADALERRFPVLIGESTPRYVGCTDSDLAIERWFEPYRRFLQENPHCKGTGYINWNWASYPMWSDWGDCRLTASEAVQDWYRTLVSHHAFVHADVDGKNFGRLCRNY
ncbi:MAG: glycosyl hydrolase [Spirochaetaceae bacterium]